MNAAMLMVCLAGSAAVGQPSETVFKAAGIEVRTEAAAQQRYSRT